MFSGSVTVSLRVSLCSGRTSSLDSSTTPPLVPSYMWSSQRSRCLGDLLGGTRRDTGPSR